MHIRYFFKKTVQFRITMIFILLATDFIVPDGVKRVNITDDLIVEYKYVPRDERGQHGNIIDEAFSYHLRSKYVISKSLSKSDCEAVTIVSSLNCNPDELAIWDKSSDIHHQWAPLVISNINSRDVTVNINTLSVNILAESVRKQCNASMEQRFELWASHVGYLVQYGTDKSVSVADPTFNLKFTFNSNISYREFSRAHQCIIANHDDTYGLNVIEPAESNTPDEARSTPVSPLPNEQSTTMINPGHPDDANSDGIPVNDQSDRSAKAYPKCLKRKIKKRKVEREKLKRYHFPITVRFPVPLGRFREYLIHDKTNTRGKLSKLISGNVYSSTRYRYLVLRSIKEDSVIRNRRC